MLDVSFIGILAWNVVLVGVLGFMVRVWMNDVKGDHSHSCRMNREDHDRMSHKLEEMRERVAKLEVRTEK
jgi:uncharacterized membrane protein